MGWELAVELSTRLHGGSWTAGHWPSWPGYMFLAVYGPSRRTHGCLSCGQFDVGFLRPVLATWDGNFKKEPQTDRSTVRLLAQDGPRLSKPRQKIRATILIF